MQLDWLKRLSPTSNMFVTTFNKLSNTTSQQGKQLPKVQVQQTLPPLPRELNAMETIYS
jgi:hypothetical protein